jgi:hypothetical protein
MKLFCLLLSIVISNITFGQNTTDYYNRLKSIDLSDIFAPDSLTGDGPGLGIDKFKMPERLGFIGHDYTRFRIHFVSISKSVQDPFTYLVSGKTRVHNNICDFTGTIRMLSAETYASEEFPNFREGSVLSEVLFYEDSSQAGSGVISGQLRTYFYLDKGGRLKYNSLMLAADGFNNNAFTGSWTSYKTKQSKKCNWGDFRIPESGDLDIGAGEFSPSDKYLKNGWQSYRDAFGLQVRPPDIWWEQDEVNVIVPRDDASSKLGTLKHMWVGLKNYIYSGYLGSNDFIKVWADNAIVDSTEALSVTPLKSGIVTVYSKQRIYTGHHWKVVATKNEFIAIHKPEVTLSISPFDFRKDTVIQLLLKEKGTMKALSERYEVGRMYEPEIYNANDSLIGRISPCFGTTIERNKLISLQRRHLLHQGFRMKIRLCLRDKETDLLFWTDELEYVFK